MTEDSYANVPEEEIQFIQDEDIGLQIAITDFMLNQILGTIIMTNFTNILPQDIFDELDFHLTTDMFEPIIPELTSKFGNKNMNFMFQLSDGTWISFDKEKEIAKLKLRFINRILIEMAKHEGFQPKIDTKIDKDNFIASSVRIIDQLVSFIYREVEYLSEYVHWLYMDP